MASIQHYVCDADIFPLEIIKKHAALEDIEKERHFAALKIQRLWRGYVVRKMVAGWHRAATVLQKYIRRWLVLWHLPEFYSDYLDWYRRQFYDRMATKIQACWRGYWVRRDRVPIKELLARRLAIQKANEDIQRQMREAFENMEKLRKQQMEKEAHEWVLYILFKLHHHLRTRTRQGIYSLHGQTKLSDVEHLIKAIPLRQYMHELKKIYYKAIGEEKPRQYIYKTKHLQAIEDTYKNRDRSHEPKSKAFAPDLNIHSKPFKLTPKLDKADYERLLLCTEQYVSKAFDFSRAVEKDKHLSKHDFDLHVLKKSDKPLKPPPYYIDFWAKICEVHNIPD